MNKLTDCFTLSNGVKIPCVGYGTWKSSIEDAKNGVIKAIEVGYRHIDTAAAYENESGVGAGIRESGIKREDLFVTTKHWITERGYDKTLRAVDESLKQLGLDYVELYLVHWPCVECRNPNWKAVNADTWRGFEQAFRDGKIRALGLSNFEKKHVDALMQTAQIAPVVNQIEFHPGYTQMENVRFSQQAGMLVEAWSPLGSGAVLNDPFLNEMARRYNRSVAQLCIRFALQHDVLPLPKSVTPARIAQNAQVFDFTISPEDMKAMDEMPLLGFSTYRPEEAPADALYD